MKRVHFRGNQQFYKVHKGLLNCFQACTSVPISYKTESQCDIFPPVFSPINVHRFAAALDLGLLCLLGVLR